MRYFEDLKAGDKFHTAEYEMTTDEIIVEFPQLTVEKIRAALSFAASRERMTKMVAA